MFTGILTLKAQDHLHDGNQHCILLLHPQKGQKYILQISGMHVLFSCHRKFTHPCAKTESQSN